MLCFLEHLVERRDRFKISIVHKPFSLICKTVDWVVEPALHVAGENLYSDGWQLRLSDLLYVSFFCNAHIDYTRKLLGDLQAFLLDPVQDNWIEVSRTLVDYSGLLSPAKYHDSMAKEAATNLAHELAPASSPAVRLPFRESRSTASLEENRMTLVSEGGLSPSWSA